MKTAVTTAGGRLGRAVVKEMIAQVGIHDVIGVARNPEKPGILGSRSGGATKKANP